MTPQSLRLSRFPCETSESSTGNSTGCRKPVSIIAKAPGETLPVDAVGWASNISCSWIHRYRVSRDTLQKRANLPQHHQNLLDKTSGATPKMPHIDGVEMNGRRMKGKYREELQTHGQLKGSMFRVMLKFCKTRIFFATLFHILAICLGFLGPILFLNLTLHSMRNEQEVLNNRTAAELSSNSINATESDLDANATTRMQFQREVGIPVLNRIGFAVGISLCFFLKTIFLSTSNWINLRTAMRLRTGSLATAFESVMKSVITYAISPHQLMTLVMEEGDYMVEMIMKGHRVVGNLLSFVIAFIVAIGLLSTPGMWPLFVIFGLLILAIPLAKISTYHMRKSFSYLAKKLTQVEEFCLYFRDIVIFGNHENTTKKKFLNAMEEQHSSMKWAYIFSTNFSGKLTSAMLLGGLYMMWCDPQVQTESIDVLTLMILYAFIVQNYVADFFQSLGAIFNGKAILDKLMHIYNMKSASPAKYKPESYRVIFINDKEFRWHSSLNEKKSNKYNPPPKEEAILRIKEFYVASDQIVGLTGPPKSGKSMLLYSILGHTQWTDGITGLSKGAFQKRGKIAFFPEDCALCLGSLKDNILMGAEFDEKLFYEAINGAQLNDILIRPGMEDEDIGSLELSVSQLDRLTLAQAIYTNRNIILLDNPMSRYTESSDGDVFRLFNNFFNILRNQKKTVILATQDHNFLALCGRIYVMENCSIAMELNYQDLTSYPNYENWNKNYAKLRNVINAERLNGCNPAGITPFVKKDNRKAKGHFNGDGTTTESEQVLIVKDGSNLESTISITNLMLLSVFLVIVHVIISGSYITLPGYIILAQVLSIELWISLISFGFVCVSFVMELFDRIYTSKIGEKYSVKHEKDKLELLLTTSMNFLYNRPVSDLVFIFMANSHDLLYAHRYIIHKIVLILVATVYLTFANPWTIIVIVLLSIACTWIYFYLKTTVEETYGKEFETRRKMFRHITNCVRTRDVYGNSSKSCKMLYELLEENSTLQFMRKCVVHHAQFIMNVFLTLGLFCTCCFMLLLPNASLDEQKLRYTYGLLLYLIIARNFQEMIQNGIFERAVAAKNTAIVSHLVHDLEKTRSLDVVESVSDHSKSLSVSIMNVIGKMGNVRKLNIKEVHVNAGEKVGILMEGSHLLVPMFGRVLSPQSGVIFFGQKDIASFPEPHFRKIVGFISSDLQPSSATILSIINPYNKWEEKDLEEVMRDFELGQKISILPKKLNDTISHLTADEKQILCLVKIVLEKPTIVIVENPHPDALNKINSTINDSFKEATVIKIATSQHQLISCKRIL
ncbi:ABC transporter C family member 3-like [Phlebotomus argentipes]|uniref:ABC transporter C family member 3-like n=1 Tax=Phlebotomus argentipes TaxID=94469 RepID=UPI002892D416|nr:ABC transporter C family member 3-like [Phlebotomus argentipes]